MTNRDWAAWSREAKRLMQDRNDVWQREWEIDDGASYRWTLDPPELMFERIQDVLVAHVTVVGTCSQSEGTFLWAWANESMPAAAVRDLDMLRAFGAQHDLTMLIDPEWPAGHGESLEALIVAGRILDAKGTYVDNTGNVTIYFALRGFETRRADSTSRILANT